MFQETAAPWQVRSRTVARSDLRLPRRPKAWREKQVLGWGNGSPLDSPCRCAFHTPPTSASPVEFPSKIHSVLAAPRRPPRGRLLPERSLYHDPRQPSRPRPLSAVQRPPASGMQSSLLATVSTTWLACFSGLTSLPSSSPLPPFQPLLPSGFPSNAQTCPQCVQPLLSLLWNALSPEPCVAPSSTSLVLSLNCLFLRAVFPDCPWLRWFAGLHYLLPPPLTRGIERMPLAGRLAGHQNTDSTSQAPFPGPGRRSRVTRCWRWNGTAGA